MVYNINAPLRNGIKLQCIYFNNWVWNFMEWVDITCASCVDSACQICLRKCLIHVKKEGITGGKCLNICVFSVHKPTGKKTLYFVLTEICCERCWELATSVPPILRSVASCSVETVFWSLALDHFTTHQSLYYIWWFVGMYICIATCTCTCNWGLS